jgi:PAS domain S-box-containing protein
MQAESTTNLLLKIRELEEQLSEANQLIQAIREGEVDAFAVRKNNSSEIYTLQSGDYAYRVLIEKFGEGALNLTEDGLIVYCNTYFFELLNLPYEKVIGSFIFDLVAEESQNTFRELFASSLTGNSKGEIIFSIKGRSIPVYISLTSLQPNLPTVGMIITDLTEKKRHEEVVDHYNLQLAVKNQELENQNSELASFAYVASHDLQEPLRKIQAFSSRILEKEEEHFSAAGKDYFVRMRGAAARMQKLIEALLNYSRTSTASIAFKPTDLNDVMEEAKKNLMDDIQGKDVLIESAKLPVLNLVPLQFHQLLVNLIANAIKYSKPGIQSHIKVSADLLTTPADLLTVPADLLAAYHNRPASHDHPPEDDKKRSAKFWKISVEDNGIGFKQEYAERIFELFQRLHGRSEYEGTGVGLAICKKIVQNHHGSIKAIGQPGIGATFAIYLPFPG